MLMVTILLLLTFTICLGDDNLWWSLKRERIKTLFKTNRWGDDNSDVFGGYLLFYFLQDDHDEDLFTYDI